MKRVLTLIAAVLALTISAVAQDTVTKTFTFGEFTGIAAGYTHEIYVTEGNSNKIEVTCPKEYVKYLNYYVTNGILHLDIDLPNKRKFRNRHGHDSNIIVRAQMTKIESITLSGAAALIPSGRFKANNLNLTLSGAGEIKEDLLISANSLIYNLSGASEGSVKGDFSKANGHMSGASEFYLEGYAGTFDLLASGAANLSYKGKTETIKLQCSGSSEVDLEGVTKDIDIKCSGAAEVDAEEMIAENAWADASGASQIKVFGNGYVELRSTIAASIKYYGEARNLNIRNESISRGR